MASATLFLMTKTLQASVTSVMRGTAAAFVLPVAGSGRVR
jgi:hypothetical protein